MLSVHSYISKHASLAPIPEDDSVTSECSAEQVEKAITTAVRKGIFDMVNAERMAHQRKPFKRSRFLDGLASIHANYMAEQRSAIHSVQSIVQLQVILHSKLVAENVQQGEHIRDMHNCTMTAQSSLSRQNILSKHFHEMGCAVARGSDGKIYLCQLFRK